MARAVPPATRRRPVGHEAVEVTALSAADVAASRTFIRRLRRAVVGAPAPKPVRAP